MSESVTSGGTNHVFISFSGIYAVVRGTTGKREGGEAAIVAMPGAHGAHMTAHLPVLTVEPRFVSAASAPATTVLAEPNPTVQDGDSGRPRGNVVPYFAWDLSGSRVRLLPGGFPSEPDVTFDLRDIQEMAGLHEKALFDPALLSSLSARAPVSAAILVDRGALASWEPNDSKEYQFVDGKDQAQTQPSALSDGVTLHIEDAPATLVIEIVSARGVQLITLLAKSQRIEAAFTSLPTRVDFTRSENDKIPVRLPHFLMYYGMLCASVPSDDRCYPKESTGTEPILETPRCKPGVQLKMDAPVVRAWNEHTTVHKHEM